MRKLAFLLSPLVLSACVQTGAEPSIEVAATTGVHGELGDIRDRIEDARDGDLLTRRQARKLKKESRMIGDMAERYGSDGLSDAEARELENRANYLRDAVLAPGQQSDPGRPKDRR